MSNIDEPYPSLEIDREVDSLEVYGKHLGDDTFGETTSKSHFQKLRKFLPIITFDLISLSLVLLTTYEVIHSKLLMGLGETAYFLSHHIDRVLFYGSLVLLVLALFRWSNLYEHKVVQSRVEQFFYIIKSFIITDIVIIVFAFLFLEDTISGVFKDFLIWFNLIGIGVTFSGRLAFRFLIKGNLWLSTMKIARKVIVIGAGQSGKLYAAYLKHKIGNVNIVFLDDDDEKYNTKIFDYTVQGKPEDVIYKAIEKQSDEVCIVINNIKKQRLLEIIKVAKKTGLPIKVWSNHYNMIFTGMYKKSNDILESIPINHHSNQNFDLFIKRCIDLILASVGFILLFIPGLIIYSIIKLTSSGPAIHSSYRIGKDGNKFKMFKFRSMRVNVEDMHQQIAVERLTQGRHMGKVINDSRVTPIGHFLRKYALDELPQIINVLQGYMSLVGPRPCFNYEMNMFEDWHHRRFAMKPGITGLWQITGRQMGAQLLNDAMTTDVFYTDNYFLWMDFRILFRTIPIVLNGKGK